MNRRDISKAVSTIARCLVRGIFVLALLALAGCVDYDEEMWLNPDLSGVVELKVSVQEDVARATNMERDFNEDSVRNQLQQFPGVKLDSFESFREAGKIVAKLRISFDALEKLSRHENGFSQATPASFLGAITLTQDGRKTVLVRTVPAISQAHGANLGKELLAKGLSSLLFAKNHLSYKLHLPGEILSANSSQIDHEEHTVEWNYTLAEAMQQPPEMQVEWKRPLGVFMWLGIAGGIIILGFIALLIKRKYSFRER